nr:MAG TPA: zinc-ribbon containing domain protein [Caudoviricetes sp.]
MSQVIVLGWLIVAGLTAVAAHAKNRSAFEGFLVGIFFPVLGMVIYLIIKPSPGKSSSIKNGLLVNSSGERACPSCSEFVKMQASKCKHCGSDLTSITDAEAKAAHDAVYGPMRSHRTILVLLLGIAVVAFGYFNQQ